MGVVCRCKAKEGLRSSPRDLHTRARLPSLLRLNLDSSLKTTWFRSAAVQFPRAWHHSKWKCQWVGVKSRTLMGVAIPNVLQPGPFVWFLKTRGPLVKMLPVPGWRLMKQLNVHVHFLGCGLLDDWCRGHPEPGVRVRLIDVLAFHSTLMILPLTNCDMCSYCLRKRCNGMSTSILSL
ncbi:e3 ubiquitin-protein ligase RNF13 [Trichonephila clavipes]|nr:e3 ubiquitin-protein ligase RNF13 [Trichonephila clavipes]